MSSTEEEILLIEAYLEHKLDTYKTLQVEKRIKEDKAFAQRVEDYRSIIEGVEAMGAEEFTSQLESWEDENPYTKPKALWWPLAAMLMALAVVIGYWLIPEEPLDGQDLFASHFQPYDDIISTRNIDDTALLNKAFSFYNNQQFDSAALYFGGYLEIIPDRSIEFYQAVSLLAHDHHQEALPILFKLSQDRGFLLQEAAQWYLGLAQLKAGDQDRAVEILSNIKETEGHDFQEQAREILSDLKE